MALKFLNNGYFAGKVGIGTASPDTKLSISDILGISGTGNNTYGQVDLVNTQTGTSGDQIGPFITFRGKRGAVDTTIAAYGAIGAVNTGTSGNSMGALTFLVKNAVGAAQDLVEQMRISAGGNVGIGVTGPTDKLTVNGNLSIFGNKIYNGSASNSAGVSFPSSTTRIDGYNGITFHSSQTTVGSQTERMRITSTGNVGIGTTSPGGKLHVAYSNSSVYSTTSPSGDLIVSRHNTSNVDDQTVGIRFDTTGFAGTTTGQAAIQAIQPSNLSSADLAFLTRNNATFGEKMRITSVGNVGIGTTSPDRKLHVFAGESNGAASNAQSTLVLENSTNTYLQFLTPASSESGILFGDTDNDRGALTYSHSSDAMNFRVAAETKMYINSSGNVGIGTTGPLDKLDVSNGNIRISQTSNVAAQLILNTYQSALGNTTYKWFVEQTTSANSYSFQIGNGTTPYLHINSLLFGAAAGNVGIGTTSPSYKLHVNGGDAQIANGSTATLYMNNSNNYLYGDVNGVGIVAAGNNFRVKTNNSERLRIIQNGNVGIGTTSPLSKLQVGLSTSNAGSTLAMLGAAESGILSALSLVNTLGNSAAGYGTALDFHVNAAYSPTGRIATIAESTATPAALAFYTYNSGLNEKMRITSAGNVGIGLTNPADRLDLYDSDDNVGMYFHTATSGTGGGNGLRVGQNNANAFVWNYEATPLSLATGGTARLTINATGGIRFNTGYGAGTLVTDASGNVTVSSGGGAGGPYLPLAGGTMTAGAVVTFLASSGSTDDRLKFGTTGQMQLFHDGSDGYIINSLGDVRMDVNTFRVRSSGGTETMIKSTQNAGVELYYNDSKKFETTSTGVNVTGEVVSGSSLVSKSTSTGLIIRTTTNVEPYLAFQRNSGSNGVGVIRLLDGGDLTFDTGTTGAGQSTRLTIDGATGNATFTGNVTANGTIQILDSAANLTISGDTNGNAYYNNSVGTHRFRAGGSSVNSMEISSTYITLNEPVTATSTVTATTFLGDLNGTINTATTAVTQVDAVDNDTVATTAYVNNKIALIPAGLVFQGTWNASTNTPTLTSGSGTTGNFYIVSVAGSTNLDGITDWKVGDWAVFIEQGLNDQWEKIDNSSVLDGIGTGGSVAGWAGSGTSNTLTNSPITFSGNNTGFPDDATFDTNIILEGNIYHKNDTNTYFGFNPGASEDDTIIFNTAGSERMRITSGGNVGIGTASPQRNLTIYESSGNAVLQLANNTSGVGASDGFLAYTDGVNVGLENKENGYLSLATNASEKMRITSDGNVGIGKTPQARNVLDIQRNDTLGSFITHRNDLGFALNRTYADYGNDGDTVEYQERIGVDGNLSSIGNFSNHTLGIQTNNQNRITILSGGNVGIGTTSPDAKLDVNGGLNSTHAIFSGQDGRGLKLSTENTLNNDDGVVYDAQTSTGKHLFKVSGGEKMRIDYNGNVGIGNTTPNYKLTVSGGIEAGGVVTYSKVAGSLDTTGYAVAGLTAANNGASAGFEFKCYGGTGKYQRISYSCYCDSGTWRPRKMIDEGSNTYDVVASADGTTITFTFKTRSGSQGYSPRVVIEATGHSINSTYA